MFKLEPTNIVANDARIVQLNRVKKSMICLLDECIKKLKLQEGNIGQICSVIEKMEGFSPNMHFLHDRLQFSMRGQDVQSVRLHLEKIVQEVQKVTGCDQYISVETLKGVDWEDFIVKEAIRLTKQDCGEEAEILALSEAELAEAKNHVFNALCLIARNDQNMFDELKVHVRVIKLFTGKVTMGFTDVRILGAMLLRLPRKNIDPVLYFVEHIVHEASHMHLNCLMAKDPLILNSPEERFISPLRPDPRPMIGVYHATYVSARIARTFCNIYAATGDKRMLKIVAETLDETIRGVSEISRSARLTFAGKEILASIKCFFDMVSQMPEWMDYPFKQPLIHRFGVGETKVDSLYKEVV